MATARQIRALIESHAEGDDVRFFSVAMQVAAEEARSGHGQFAKELRELIDETKARLGRPPATPAKTIPITQPRGDLAGLMSVGYPETRLGDMVLDEAVQDRIRHVLSELGQTERLEKYGLSPCRKLLLIGPPGTGKTMTATALGGETHLPLFTILLDGLITKYMGETAAKLRLIFDAIGQVRGVYFFDEIDALGSDRRARNDVGEIRRVLNSFLQFLEQDRSTSLIVGATNHPDLLDRAIFRRFDDVIRYTLPTGSMVENLIRNRLGLLELGRVEWNRVALGASDLSHADIVRACEQAAKRAVLAKSTCIETEALLMALEDLKSRHSSEK
jgi:AAA+ superfamily predicted ATPase